MKQKHILLIILFSFVFLSDDYKTDSSINNLLEEVVNRYNSSLSCSLLIESESLTGKINVDMASINDSTVLRKTKLHFIEGLDYPMVAWMWTMKSGKDKKWITKPNGKKVDVSKRKELDLPLILPNPSILDGYYVVSDTLNYNNRKCVVIDEFKISRGKKKGPLSKLWISIDSKLINKIEEIDYKKGIVIKETVIEYHDLNDSPDSLEASIMNIYPKLIHINDFKKNQSSSIEISNYLLNQNFDLTIFDPVDIK